MKDPMYLGKVVLNNGGSIVTQGGQIVVSVSSTGVPTVSTSVVLQFKDAETINDNNGNALMTFGVVASAVNDLKITNSATGSDVLLAAVGTDANIGIDLSGKGTGPVKLGQATSSDVRLVADQPIADSAGNAYLKFTKTATAVNWLNVKNNSTGLGPVLAADGETNVAVTLSGKGTGAVNVGQATSTGVVLLADQPIQDSSGNAYLKFTKAATAVNQFTLGNSATGTGITLLATGTDTDIAATLAPKGAGILTLGLSTGTGDVVVGKSSGTQVVKLGDGAGISTVNIANTSIVGANANIATAATGAGVTDTVAISTGNAAATGIKVVNILTGTPGTSGNNRLTMGGGTTAKVTTNAVVSMYQTPNYIATETGADNAIAGALTDASGANVTLAAGLRVTVKLAHALQAGANTFNLNGGGAVAIKKHTNVATDISTAYVNTGAIDLMYSGAAWYDMAQ